MCGIFGFIGQPTNQKAMYALLTQLALKTEHRGKEATGFWGAQGGDNGQIIYHKEPITATEFVQRTMWKKALRQFNPNIMLAHCREPTQGVGSPKTNRNNHPHVNSDYTVALTHNGRVEEYFKLKNKFASIRSECDSELLLRIFETGEYVPNAEFLAKKYPQLESENAFRVYGIEEIYKRLDKSHMAVAVGERHEGSRRSLWLFRNEKRPLHMIDLRASFGVIIYCSTMTIWREAVEAAPEVKPYIPLNHEIVEFPISPPHAYAISFDPTAKDEVEVEGSKDTVESGWKNGWKIRKYKLILHREYGEEEEDKLQIPATSPRPMRSYEVVTMLNSNDEVMNQATIITPVATGDEDVVESANPGSNGELEAEPEVAADPPQDDVTKSNVNGSHEPPDDGEDVHDAEVEGEVNSEEEDESELFDFDKLSQLSCDIKSVVSELATEAHNRATQGDIKPQDFKQILDDMEQTLADVTSIKYHSFHPC